ncbi:tRNA pseudouridine synthase B [Thioalkalivibrio nitratireducens DSM 14787]|uniref:tRNA pseudouridine synthase B n=1 Tax=Thioalkalivibrio nitratireducens (strain DSM 14787 / UNIQEM 213 / ALEN2) TaxID=1255043 RepID=L0E0K3_THIND|nr:tRNA pseudouridine(55) synthase TruB [Thioalkalivibrio nitratireducens]AGA34745.1 tRNA pseudouridine synthase B [Thioalkalivibrio nitratireducens DSM 14787]
MPIQRRDIDGIILLDKPRGLSSNQALGRVKYLLAARKAGHTGSLDPLATGLLPLCFGQATKVSGWLLDADKHYVAVARLGVETSTGDMEGEILREHTVPALTGADVDVACARFRGEIQQVPPMHSALKHQGQRLYALARKGIEVERPARTVTIHALRGVLEAPDRLRVEVHCSKGTYIRTLIEDLGRALGCGAAVAELRRTGHGSFDAGEMVTMEELEAASAEGGPQALERWLRPADSALADCPEVRLDAASTRFVRQGQPVFVARIREQGPLRLYGSNGEFLGVGELLDDGRVAPRRLFVAGAAADA